MDRDHDLDRTSGILSLLSDPTRMRLMALLNEEELTVAEVMSVTELGQSRVSTHLGKLKSAGLLCDRRAGASVFYRTNDASMPAHARNVWGFLFEQMNDPVLEKDRSRRQAVVRARANGSFPESVAGAMERHYSPGRTWEAATRGLAGLLRLGRVLDLGAGDGTIAELLSPVANEIVCLDSSVRMVAAGKERLQNLPNVTFVHADMHVLPFSDETFDQILLFHSLTYVSRPAQVLAEVARVLACHGRVAILTLKAHKHDVARAEYNHVHLGFEPRRLKSMLTTAGLDVDVCEVTSRERREPHFEVLTAHATKAMRRNTARAKRST